MSNENIAICFAFHEGTIPYSLSQEYSILRTLNSSFCLEFSDLIEVSNILIKYPLSPFFVLKIVSKIAQYKYFIRKFDCRALIVTSEYSFTSSYLTSYCKKNNLKHINIMHGEKFYHILDSFFSFDKCYVWDIHYVNIFQKLHASQNQFIVEKPPILSELEKYSDIVGSDFKYYLDGTESILEIRRLAEYLEIKFKNVNVIFRAHPVFTDFKMLKDNLINFENPDLVKISDSLKSCEYVCAKFSTVLFQGSLMNRKIVIDDISDPKLFKQLEKMEYIIFSKRYIKLSELLNI